MLLSIIFFLLLRRTPRSTLFPYTTLFRSIRRSSIFAVYLQSSNFVSLRSDLFHKFHLQPTLCFPSTCSRSEEHTSELQSQSNLVCRLLLEKKKLLTVLFFGPIVLLPAAFL